MDSQEVQAPRSASCLRINFYLFIGLTGAMQICDVAPCMSISAVNVHWYQNEDYNVNSCFYETININNLFLFSVMFSPTYSKVGSLSLQVHLVCDVIYSLKKDAER